MVGLARAIDLEVAGAEVDRPQRDPPATYIGKGKVETIAAGVKAEEIDLVVMDCALSRRSSVTSRKPSAARSSTAPG